eukprot:3417618-Amphidinium_carterae.1
MSEHSCSMCDMFLTQSFFRTVFRSDKMLRAPVDAYGALARNVVSGGTFTGAAAVRGSSAAGTT